MEWLDKDSNEVQYVLIEVETETEVHPEKSPSGSRLGKFSVTR